MIVGIRAWETSGLVWGLLVCFDPVAVAFYRFLRQPLYFLRANINRVKHSTVACTYYLLFRSQRQASHGRK